MTTIAVVQARMGSTRLPGKVLMDMGGRPALVLMLDRLQPVLGRGVDHLVVATSDLVADDPVAAAAGHAGADVVRGSEADVLARFVAALDTFPAEVVVRLTADCPLADPGLVIDALALHASSGAAYTSNTLVRTFPDGLDVEVLAADALRAADREARDPAEREHVTPFVYRRPERFALRALRGTEPLGEERWTVDDGTDLERVRQLVAALDDPVSSPWTEILAVAGRRRGPVAGQVWVRPLESTDVVPLAEAGHPVPPELAAHPEDAGVRTWSAEVDGRRVGWVAVTVTDGHGRLAHDVADPDRDAALARVRRRLGADLQVSNLIESA